MEIELLHKHLLELLIAFDDFCRAHHIQYSLHGGTLLGAVREKRFIPWDDDVDVTITRAEYEKLTKALAGNDTFHVVGNIKKQFRKIGNNDLWIDLFICDYISDKPLAQKMKQLSLTILDVMNRDKHTIRFSDTDHYTKPKQILFKACYYLGCLYYDRFRYEEAAESWQEGLRRDGSQGKVWRNLALYWFDKATQPEKATVPVKEEVTLQIHGAPEAVENVPQEGGLSLQEIYKKNIPSVVSISCTTRTGTSTGSGVVLSEDGYLLTNSHVVEGAVEITVLFQDESAHTATLVGADTVSDLAVLYVKTQGLTPAEFGDDTTLRVGDSYEPQNPKEAGYPYAPTKELEEKFDNFRWYFFESTLTGYKATTENEYAVIDTVTGKVTAKAVTPAEGIQVEVYAFRDGQVPTGNTYNGKGGRVGWYRLKIVNSERIQLEGVRILPEALSLEVGETYQLKAVPSPLNASVTTTSWTKTGMAISLKDGLVTALKPGQSNVTVKLIGAGAPAPGGVTYTIPITVYAADHVH